MSSWRALTLEINVTWNIKHYLNWIFLKFEKILYGNVSCLHFGYIKIIYFNENKVW